MQEINTKEPQKAAKAHPVLPLTGSDQKYQVAITLNQLTPEFVYSFWRDFSNIAIFMKDIHSVEVLSPETSKWQVKLKSGIEATWTAKITADQPGKYIAWKSIEGDVETSGAVSFTQVSGKPGTIVTLAMDYKIPGGKLGEIATRLMGENPEQLISTNLKRLRGLLETGEIATIEGQTSGRSEDADTQKNNLH